MGSRRANEPRAAFSPIVGFSSATLTPDVFGTTLNLVINCTNFHCTPSTPQRSPLEDFSLYLIDLRTGRVTDRIHFKVDKIYLSHNQGLYLYNNTLAIMSVQHQTIHIYELYDGRFVQHLHIGRFCSHNDQLLYEHVYPAERPFREATINMLKHRVLTFLYRQAHAAGAAALRRFYQYFDAYQALRMWKMQLLDDAHLLIKYATEDVVIMKAAEPNNQPSYFVVYHIWDARVLAMYDNTSERLLELFEQHSDAFRNARMHSDTQFPCSPNNNVYARLLQQRFKTTIVSARGGGVVEATKRILAQLPISAQSYSTSPYLDLSLFSYDDKWVSVMERPKACGEYPILFFARDSGRLKFRIYPGLRHMSVVERRLVAFTFHPTEPFVISVQRVDNDYVVNFHVYNARTEEIGGEVGATREGAGAEEFRRIQW